MASRRRRVATRAMVLHRGVLTAAAPWLRSAGVQGGLDEFAQAENPIVLKGCVGLPEWVLTQVGAAVVNEQADDCFGHDAPAHWAELAGFDYDVAAVRGVDDARH